MASLAGVLASERWLDEVIVAGSISTISADVEDSLSVPAGLGDLAVMEMEIDAVAVTTVSTVALNKGAMVYVTSPDAATTLDIIGTPNRWVECGSLRLQIFISPDPLVLWRQNELIVMRFPRLDNGATSFSYAVRVKCVRVRPQVVPERALQLVR